jgi:hypothetical protein
MNACLTCIKDKTLFKNYLLKSMQVSMTESVVSVCQLLRRALSIGNKQKVGLLNMAEELGNVSKACQVMGRQHSWTRRIPAE